MLEQSKERSGMRVKTESDTKDRYEKYSHHYGRVKPTLFARKYHTSTLHLAVERSLFYENIDYLEGDKEKRKSGYYQLKNVMSTNLFSALPNCTNPLPCAVNAGCFKINNTDSCVCDPGYRNVSNTCNGELQ